MQGRRSLNIIFGWSYLPRWSTGDRGKWGVRTRCHKPLDDEYYCYNDKFSMHYKLWNITPIPDTETGGNCCKDGSGITGTESGGIICLDGVKGTVVSGEFVPDASTTSTTTTTTSSVSTTSGETGCDVATVACGTKCTPDPTSTCKDGQCLDLFGAAISCAEPLAGSTTGSTSNVSNNNQVGFGADINQGDVTTPSIDAGETDEAITASDAFHVKASATAMSLVILAVVGIN